MLFGRVAQQEDTYKLPQFLRSRRRAGLTERKFAMQILTKFSIFVLQSLFISSVAGLPMWQWENE